MKTTTYDCPLLKDKDNTKMKAFEDGRLRTEAQEFCLNHCPLKECFYVTYRQHKKLTCAERGRLGGYVTSSRYRHEMSEWGREGGKSKKGVVNGN
jgi:hypothetical protein